MNNFNEYENYDGLGLAELVREGAVQPIELVEAAIARIEKLNPQINAVIHKMYDQACQAAESPLPDGPFAGVPFLLKDLLSGYAGEPLRNGSRFHRHQIAPEHSELVRRYLAAGLIVLGKTNTPEYGITGVTEPELFGATSNPWDLTRTSGGSSGGAAAAVAARMVPMAHGGDGLGSIRIPASCCGLFGLKPTRGRTPGYDYVPWQNFVCEHVLTRSVRDSAAMLDATAITSATNTNYLQQVSTPPGKLRIAYTSEPFLGDTIDPIYQKALANTVTLCRDLGHEMVEAKLPIDGPAFAKAAVTMLASEIRADIEEAERAFGQKASPADFEKTTWALGLLGSHISSADLVLATRLMQRTSYQILQFFKGYDVLVTPTLAQLPPVTGTLLPTGVDALGLKVIGRLQAGGLLQAMGMIDKAAADSFRFTPYTPPFSATGQPAMSVPLWWSGNGLPLGIHFIGRFGDEATLFRLAGQLEEAQPWFNKTPPILSIAQPMPVA